DGLPGPETPTLPAGRRGRPGELSPAGGGSLPRRHALVHALRSRRGGQTAMVPLVGSAGLRAAVCGSARPGLHGRARAPERGPVDGDRRLRRLPVPLHGDQLLRALRRSPTRCESVAGDLGWRPAAVLPASVYRSEKKLDPPGLFWAHI